MSQAHNKSSPVSIVSVFLGDLTRFLDGKLWFFFSAKYFGKLSHLGHCGKLEEAPSADTRKSGPQGWEFEQFPIGFLLFTQYVS